MFRFKWFIAIIIFFGLMWQLCICLLFGHKPINVQQITEGRLDRLKEVRKHLVKCGYNSKQITFMMTNTYCDRCKNALDNNGKIKHARELLE